MRLKIEMIGGDGDSLGFIEENGEPAIIETDADGTVDTEKRKASQQ